ncbi:hypothetical protein HanLR1_Chr05g0178781 [Helianthus annuus]|nr:hypothetical protein HanLR1_Chr05g0178781 [Helianthus annuus]
MVLPQGKGDLGALGDPAATGVPKQAELKISDKRARKKKTHEAVVIPPMVPEVACGSAAAGGSSAGTKPVDDKKRQGDGPVVGGQKAPKLRKTRATAIPKSKPAVTITGFGLPPPPWNVMQGDDVSNDPSACREILQGLGTPFEAARARGLPRQNRINQLSSMLVGSSTIANAIMEDYNVLGRREEETIRLRAEAEDMVRSLTKLLSDERKGWREACARENEKLFRVRQELTNLKAANTALVKEKAAAEAAAKEAEARGATALKEAEARAYKALEEADADRTKLNKAVEELKAEVQNRVAILEEVSARATKAEARARQVEKVRNGLTTSLN